MAEVDRLTGPLDPLQSAFVVLTALRWRLPTGESQLAVRTARALVERARTAGALDMLASPLRIVAGTAYRLGDWTTANSAFEEALQTAEDAGQHLYRD